MTAAGTVGLAFACGAAVGALGGLIGLGGAEFRLPLLLGVFALAAHQAVRLNLLVSLATVAVGAIARFGLAPAPDLAGHLPEVVVLAAGSTAAAYLGAGLLARLDAAALTRLIAALLLGIALLLVVEVAAGDALHLRLEPGGAARPLLVPRRAIAIGLVSSLLGVAGGELIIPTLVFGFGMDIKAAGTASLLVSLPTVAVGVLALPRPGRLPRRDDAHRARAADGGRLRGGRRPGRRAASSRADWVPEAAARRRAGDLGGQAPAQDASPDRARGLTSMGWGPPRLAAAAAGRPLVRRRTRW